MDKLNENVLVIIRAALRLFGQVWVHGDGQVYHLKEKSEFHAKYGAPETYADHWLELNENSRIPRNVDELKRTLMMSKANQKLEKQAQKTGLQPAYLSIDELGTPEQALDLKEQEFEIEKINQKINKKTK